MKQIVILSGKGGTGKTSLAAAFSHLAAEGPERCSAVLADADVDAANLELVVAPKILEREDFQGAQVASINQKACVACGECVDVCRFEAIYQESGTYHVDPVAGEGCAACAFYCPDGAITMQNQVAGQWFRSMSRYGPIYHAALTPAQDNSGKLVTLIKQRARLHALDGGHDLVIVDGPPGIGCPVISAASGADLALIVTEPSATGIHDLQRILQTTLHFGIQSLVCINKADINVSGTEQIHSYCQDMGVEVVGTIPYDISVTEAMTHGEPVTAYLPDAMASKAIVQIWSQTVTALSEAGQ